MCCLKQFYGVLTHKICLAVWSFSCWVSFAIRFHTKIIFTNYPASAALFENLYSMVTLHGILQF